MMSQEARGRRINGFASDCLDLAKARNLSPAECTTAFVAALAMLTAHTTRPGCEAAMLETMISGLQEQFAAALKVARPA